MNKPNLHITEGDPFAWSEKREGGETAAFAGQFWVEGKQYSGTSASALILERMKENLITSTDSAAAFAQFMSEVSGHFAFIFQIDDWTGMAADRIRSYPVYYRNSSPLSASNNIYQFTEAKSLQQNIDQTALLEFRMSGHCIGPKTLHKEIKQLLPGECMLINHRTGYVQKERYYLFGKVAGKVKSEDEYFERYDQVLEQTFQRLVDSLDGAPVYLPLSGGLDSRLILAMLKEFGYDRVHTYTYGVKGLWEVKRARAIAEYLGVPWNFIEFKPEASRASFLDEERKEYFQFAGGWNTTPQIPEFYGVRELRKRNCVDDDAIFINGQTGDFLTGGHIPKLFSRVDSINLDGLLEALITKHFSLWLNLKTSENTKRIRQSILEQVNLEESLTDKDLETTAKLIERFEWQERQSKYVVNGQRAYEWFGYGWRLPLWQKELMDFWSEVPWELKFRQKLHKDYLRIRNFCNVFDLELPEEYSYQPPLVKIFRKSMGAVNMVWPGGLKPAIDMYTRYNMNYAPFYPQQTYREYLKEAKWHRSPVSYWAKEYLKENHVEV